MGDPNERHDAQDLRDVSDEYAEAMRESALWDQMGKEVQIKIDAWVAQWPEYCRCCGGWGLVKCSQSHGELGREYWSEFCEALPEGVCHRCGYVGMPPWEDEEWETEQGPECSMCWHRAGD